MKKLLFAVTVLLIPSIGLCAQNNQPINIGYASTDNPFIIYGRTLAQMGALTPDTTGQIIYVSDALWSRVCISSGTTRGAWVVSAASGTFVGNSYPACQ